MAESMEDLKSQKIAMLIDGDNAQLALLEKMLAEAAKYGEVTIRRIYGDFSSPAMKKWEDELKKNAIQPIQQYGNTRNKNATDIAMIIDAMDILHSDAVDGFCLVSSDSDYTKLAMRIRESGIFVMGIGKSNTPPSFVNACKIFVKTENLASEEVPKLIAPLHKKKVSRDTKAVSERDELDSMLIKAFNNTANDNGQAVLAAMGNYLRKLDPGFDVRTYKCTQLLQLVKSRPELFDVNVTTEGPVYVKLK